MSQKYLPPDIPIVYRGGNSLKFKPGEVRIDRQSGLILPTHGISVDSDPSAVVKFGGAFRVRAIPDELRIIQRGNRQTHFVVVPMSPVTPARYQELLDDIELEELKHDDGQ